MLNINPANIIHTAPLLSCINKLPSLKSVTISGAADGVNFETTPPALSQQCPSLSTVNLLGIAGYLLFRSFVLPNMKTPELVCPVSSVDFNSFCTVSMSNKESQVDTQVRHHQANSEVFS